MPLVRTSRLRLLFLLRFSSYSYSRDSSSLESYFGDRLPVTPLQYSLPCRKPIRPHHKHTIKRALVYLLWHAQPVYNYSALLLFPTQASRCVLMVEATGLEPVSRTPFYLLQRYRYIYNTVSLKCQ